MEVPKAVLDRHRPDGPDPKPELQDCYALVSMALYGLGHSPAAFHKHLDDFFQNDGWEPLKADSCVYIAAKLQRPWVQPLSMGTHTWA